MISTIQTTQGPMGAPAGFTADDAERIIGAGWTVVGPSWQPARRDRFAKSIGGVTYRILPIENYCGRGQLVYRVGVSDFVDCGYPEYCRHVLTINEALNAI